MPQYQQANNNFLQKLNDILETNYQNESFGVSELAEEMGMSRSNLHRKLDSALKISVSQYLRQFRLKKAMEKLRETSFTVSQIAYSVGFGSVTYFSKCFHDYYGYAPGKVGTRNEKEDEAEVLPKSNKKTVIILSSVFFLVLIVVVLFVVVKPFAKEQEEIGIAVMPIKDISIQENSLFSADGIYNDIVEYLNKIDAIVVTPKSVVNVYKDSPKSPQQIASELRVNYLLFVDMEIINNMLEFNFELLDMASIDEVKEIPSYTREIEETDLNKIYEIYEDVAYSIASSLDVLLTSEEKRLIDIKPTKNPTALRYYNEAREYQSRYVNNFNLEDLLMAKKLFEKAIEEDSTYAMPYWYMTWIYNSAPPFGSNPNIYLRNKYIDSALMMIEKNRLYFPTKYSSSWEYQCYLKKGDIKKAEEAWANLRNYTVIPFWNYEVVLNSYTLINDAYNVIDSYCHCKKLKPEDRQHPVYLYRNMCWYYNHMGYPELARKTADELIEQHGETNLNQRFYIEGLSGNYEKSLEYIHKQYDSGSSNRALNLWAANNYLLLRNYEKSLEFLQKYEELTASSTDTTFIDGYFGYIYKMNGMDTKAAKRFERAIKYLNGHIKLNTIEAQRKDPHFALASIYSAMDEKEKVLEYLNEFKKRETIFLWYVNYINDLPMFDNIRDEPEFKEILSEVTNKYQDKHKMVGSLLREFGEIE